MNEAYIGTVMGIVALVVASSALAQKEGEMGRKSPKGFQRGGECLGEDARRMDSQEAMINRIINHPEIAEKIGLTEEQIKILKDSMYEMKKQEIQLEAEKKLAVMEQTKLLMESTIDEEAVMAAVEKTSKITTELVKLKVKQLLLVKKTLTPEDIKKIKELMQERREKGGKRGPEVQGQEE